jgi:hypothetical protein
MRVPPPPPGRGERTLSVPRNFLQKKDAGKQLLALTGVPHWILNRKAVTIRTRRLGVLWKLKNWL